MGLSGIPSKEDFEQMFGFVTPEDRARWAQAQTPEQKAQEKKMFANMADGMMASGSRIAEGRLHAEQTGRSVNRTPKKTTRVITEHVTTEEDLDAPYEY